MPDLADHPYRPTTGAEVTTADGRSLPLVSAKLSGAAQGGIARLVLEQRFENPYAETLHVTYRMPLPADGAVSGYAFALAGRTIVGRVQRKQEARERFERAIAAGHTAALLEQDRADIFTQSIGNLPANEALTARITVDQKLAWLPEGEWELRFPTVIGPRYVAATDRPAEARGSRVTTAPEGVRARIRISVEIRDAITAGRAPSSPSHALTAGAGGAVLLRDAGGARLDRDIVLRWPVAGAATGISLAVCRPGRGDDCYGLVTIVPPAPASLDRVFTRDLIVLIDTSGSMSGPPLDKAKQVIALLIESLSGGDGLELIEFSSEPRRYKPQPVLATPGEKQAAIRWLRGLQADGGTEMRTAVIEALRTLGTGAQRQVVIATDGYIGGEAEIVQQLHAGLPGSCQLHFVGVGSSVNRSLATAMARAGRGAEVICDLGDDAERAARRLIDRTRSPVLTHIALEGSAVLARAPETVPDVYVASPVVLAVKLGAGDLVVRGRTPTSDWERKLRIGMPHPGEGNPAIAALYGREHVADLEARRFAGEDRDAEIERTGLDFQIATRLTPFVAIDERRAVRPAVRHEAVPQELPYGTTAAAFGLRPAAAADEAFDGINRRNEPYEIHAKPAFARSDDDEPRPAVRRSRVVGDELDGDVKEAIRAQPSLFAEIIDDDIDELFADDPAGTAEAPEPRVARGPFMSDGGEEHDELDGVFGEEGPDELYEDGGGADLADGPASLGPAPAADELEAKLDASASALAKPVPFHSDADEFSDEAFEETGKVRALDEPIAQPAEGPPEAPSMAAAPKEEVATLQQRLGLDKSTPPRIMRIHAFGGHAQQRLDKSTPPGKQTVIVAGRARPGEPAPSASTPDALEQFQEADTLSLRRPPATRAQLATRRRIATLFALLAILAILAALAWWLVL